MTAIHFLYPDSDFKGAGMVIGNSICQSLMYQKTKQFNFYQVAQYGAFGFFISVYFLTDKVRFLFLEYAV